MTSGGSGTWTGGLGPVSYTQMPPTPSDGATYPMTVKVTATDTKGNASSVTQTNVILVNDCYIIT